LINRKIPSYIANFIIAFITRVKIHDFGCTLKAYKHSAIANMKIYGEMHRFLPAWCSWQGGKVTEIVVRHHPRTKGKSKYGLFRIFKVIIDLLTLKFLSGYLVKPNYIFTGSGLVFLALGFLSGILAIVDKMGPDKFPQFRIPLLLFSVFLGLTAVFLTLMGFLAELIVRLHFQTVKSKPYTLIDE
jgi:hypothetical protein